VKVVQEPDSGMRPADTADDRTRVGIYENIGTIVISVTQSDVVCAASLARFEHMRDALTWIRLPDRGKDVVKRSRP